MTEHGHQSAGAVANVAVWSRSIRNLDAGCALFVVRPGAHERQTALFERYRDR